MNIVLYAGNLYIPLLCVHGKMGQSTWNTVPSASILNRYSGIACTGIGNEGKSQRKQRRDIMVDIKECKEVLELAIGEVEAFIPSEIIESTIKHLEDYQKLKYEKSWDDFPEAMGR